MLIKQKSPSLPRNLALATFGESPIVLSTEVNLLYLFYSMAWRCCLLHLIKHNFFLQGYGYSNHDDSGISLPVFLSRTNLKLHTSLIPKMVKKVIMNLDLSRECGPDCIPVVVLKNCETKLSYILAELFNKCLKESCFPDCWKVSSVVPVFINVRGKLWNFRSDIWPYFFFTE